MHSLHPSHQAARHAGAAYSSGALPFRQGYSTAPSWGLRRREPTNHPVAMVAAAAPSSISWSEDEQKLLWSATSRALLKLGKGGVQDSHCSNLKSLLSAHSLVRVQLNADPAGASQVAKDLARGCSAHLLGMNGRNMLFGNGALDKAQLLSVAQKASGRIQAYNQKKKEASDAAAAAPPASGDVQNKKQGTSPASKPSTKGFGGNQGRSGVDRIIAQNLSSGPLTRETLKQEWENVSSTLFQDGVAQAEAEMRGLRSGSKPSTPGAFRRGTPGAFGRGGGGGRGGTAGWGGAGGRGGSGRGGRAGGAGRGQR